MLIDFDQLEETVLPNFYAGNKETRAHMFTDSLNKIMSGRLVPGASIGLHTHETSSEIIYIYKAPAKCFTTGNMSLSVQAHATIARKGTPIA